MKPYFSCPYGEIYLESAEMLCETVNYDLVVTSPPYGSLRRYNGFSFDVESTAKAMKIGLKKDGVCVWVVGDQTVNGCEQLIPFRHAQAFINAGINLYDTMIWEKPSPAVPTEGRYYDVFEYMFVFCNGKRPASLNLLADRKNLSTGSVSKHESRCNREMRKYGHKRTVAEYSRRFNVWNISRGVNKTPHPAVFPAALAKDHILSWSNPGETVLDPFGGSGTTALEAIREGRRFITGDISEEYCELMANRIEKLLETESASLF